MKVVVFGETNSLIGRRRRIISYLTDWLLGVHCLVTTVFLMRLTVSKSLATSLSLMTLVFKAELALNGGQGRRGSSV